MVISTDSYKVPILLPPYKFYQHFLLSELYRLNRTHQMSRIDYPLLLLCSLFHILLFHQNQLYHNTKSQCLSKQPVIIWKCYSFDG